jgi:hypothetical protein
MNEKAETQDQSNVSHSQSSTPLPKKRIKVFNEFPDFIRGHETGFPVIFFSCGAATHPIVMMQRLCMVMADSMGIDVSRNDLYIELSEADEERPPEFKKVRNLTEEEINLYVTFEFLHEHAKSIIEPIIKRVSADYAEQKKSNPDAGIPTRKIVNKEVQQMISKESAMLTAAYVSRTVESLSDLMVRHMLAEELGIRLTENPGEVVLRLSDDEPAAWNRKPRTTNVMAELLGGLKMMGLPMGNGMPPEFAAVSGLTELPGFPLGSLSGSPDVHGRCCTCDFCEKTKALLNEGIGKAERF